MIETNIKSAKLIMLPSDEEWLLERRKGIGGSDIAAICGLSPWQSEFSMWAEKTGALELKDANQAMNWGIKLEPIIRTHYQNVSAIPKEKMWYKKNALFRSKKSPIYQASLDGYVMEDNIIFEGKTTSAFNSSEWGEEGTGDIPKFYICQALWIMGVIEESNKVDIAALIGGNNFKIYHIHRDNDLIKELQNRADEFWGYVKSGTPPPVNDSSKATRQALGEVFSDPDDEIIEGGKKAESAMKSLSKVKEKMRSLEDKKTLHENTLKNIIGNSCGVKAGNFCYTWKERHMKRLNVSELKKNNKEIYDKYLRDASQRILIQKKLKD